VPPELSIVKVDKRHYRTIAQENWGLTEEQMEGRHVHHRIPVFDKGTNDPSNLYVCTGLYHDLVWHGGDGSFIALASEGGKIGGKKTVELGLGVHGRSAEQMEEDGRKGGTKSAELGLGVHAPGMQSKGGKKGGKKAAELGVGAHGRTPEERAEDGRKGGKIGGKTTASQKWQSTDPNFPPHISTPGGLTRWQSARGIDTSLRVKLT
jgi:hypothetical protein